MYRITTEPNRRLVRITIVGLLSAQDVADLYQEEHEAIRAMGCALGDHLALVDLRGCPLQFQDVVNAFRANIAGQGRARRLALVTGQSVARMQARRIIDTGEAALFGSTAEAEAWLFSESSARAA